MKLITEISHDLQLVESKADGFNIVGIWSSAGLKNNNNRVYKKDILEREINKVNGKIKDKTLWGELGHPPNPEINPERIAILTTVLEWKGDHVYGKAKVLETPMGNIAKTLIKEGKMGISSRGLGTVSEDGNVNEDFNLITWDLVTDPSNNPSWVNGIYEAQEFFVGNKRIEKTQEQIERETILGRLGNIIKLDPKYLAEENGYIAFFKNQKVEVYASTLFQAKEKALAEFKKKFPKIKDFHMLHVHLAEKDGEQVTHTADF